MMNTPYWREGPSITLMEVLNNRENRANLQRSLLSTHQQTLVCLTLNIAGPQKVNRLIHKAYLEGKSALLSSLQAADIPLLFTEEVDSNTGYEGFFIINSTPDAAKIITLQIEDEHPLGRLYDFDVLSPAGEKLSRNDFGYPERTCLLCGQPAFQCGRNRTHTASELYAHAMSMIAKYFSRKFALTTSACCAKGMLYEVMTTPKPGLVDRHHTGAHTDMDVSLFVDSIDSLTDYFYDCTILGIQHTYHKTDSHELSQLFSQLRKRGIQAETQMLLATNGINTHKGIVFSGGILCGALGHLYSTQEFYTDTDLSVCCQDMLISLEEDFTAINKRENLSHGEQLYRNYGLKGIRGEAMRGFPTLFSVGIPLFEKLRQKKVPLYQAGRKTLLHFIAYGEDTNIITRSDYQTFLQIRNKVKEFLAQHPDEIYDDILIVNQLDDWFVKKNISPGGSADLLALTYFLYFLKEKAFSS